MAFGRSQLLGVEDTMGLLDRFRPNPRADAALRAFCRHHVMLLSPRSVGLRPRIALLESQLRQEFGEQAVSKLRTVLVQDRFVVNRAGGA